jgi:hypothetical protein
MEDMSATLAGECSPWPAKPQLVALLRAAGLSASDDRYSVRVENRGRFVFQQYGGDMEPRIDADAETVEAMMADGALVSKALSLARVRHRFEVYGPDSVLAGYFHHEWAHEV